MKYKTKSTDKSDLSQLVYPAPSGCGIKLVWAPVCAIAGKLEFEKDDIGDESRSAAALQVSITTGIRSLENRVFICHDYINIRYTYICISSIGHQI